MRPAWHYGPHNTISAFTESDPKTARTAMASLGKLLRNSLDRDGSNLKGNARPVTGTWRDGYVELTFQADWPAGRPDTGGSAPARLAGWFDGDRASGRLTVEGRTDGIWTGTRKP